MARESLRHLDTTVLHRVPYKVYARMIRVSENRHLRMSYRDGTLEVLSLRLLEHETSSRRMSSIVATVAGRLGLAYDGVGSTTFHRGGPGRHRGWGREPDQGFYLASLGRLPRDRDLDLDAGDPPPDLWIEVDGRISRRGRFPVYAALGVPEVWRYRARKKSLSFLRLAGHSFEPIDRSLSLPALTPALVLEALALGDDPIESEWLRLLRDWVARTIEPPA